jgi:hypothetical protein
MFIPNNKAMVEFYVGTDRHGKRRYSSPQRFPCGVVTMREESGKTSVRTDSSASRGSAKDELLQARILFPRNVRLNFGDRVTIMDFAMTVKGVHPRYNIPGQLDHWEVALEISAES